MSESAKLTMGVRGILTKPHMIREETQMHDLFVSHPKEPVWLCLLFPVACLPTGCLPICLCSSSSPLLTLLWIALSSLPCDCFRVTCTFHTVSFDKCSPASSLLHLSTVLSFPPIGGSDWVSLGGGFPCTLYKKEAQISEPRVQTTSQGYIFVCLFRPLKQINAAHSQEDPQRSEGKQLGAKDKQRTQYQTGRLVVPGGFNLFFCGFRCTKNWCLPPFHLSFLQRSKRFKRAGGDCAMGVNNRISIDPKEGVPQKQIPLLHEDLDFPVPS